MRWLALCLVLVAGDAFGVGAFVTGNKLLGWCITSINVGNSTTNAQEALDTGQCQGYLMATSDTYNTWRSQGFISSDVYCMPHRVTVGQLERIVVKYLEARPEELHMSASSLVLTAYMQAFPCE